jgi:hypothetical protein
MLALDDQYIMPFAFEQCGGNRAGWPGTNHHHLATFHFNYGHEGSLPLWR